MRHLLRALGALAIIAAFVPGAAAQQRQTDRNAFEWSGELTRGSTLYLHNVNGSVTVEQSRGRNLEITATKSWRRGNPQDVRIEASRSGGNVVACAVWGDPDATCSESGVRRSRNRSNRNNDTQVDFVVRVPSGAHVTVNTTNGELVVGGVTGDVRAFTTNGNVTAESSEGSVEAGTTNGNVRVRMAQLPGDRASYSTTNGSITLELMGNPSFEIDARTTNGGISSDFDVVVSGTLSPNRVRGRIGSGGPTISLHTTNGNIRIRSVR